MSIIPYKKSHIWKEKMSSEEENYFKSNSHLLNDFPWLPSTGLIFKDLGRKDPKEFVDYLYKMAGVEIHNRLNAIFEEAINNSEIIPSYKSDKLNIYIYWMLRLILFALNDNNITNRIANLYSKNSLRLLEALQDDSLLYWICLDIGFDIKYYLQPIKISSTDSSNLSLDFIDFIKLAEKLRDDYRKLVNNALSNGRVFLSTHRLIRLLQEYIRNEIINFEKAKNTETEKEDRANLLKKLVEVDGFKHTFERIKSLMEEKKEELSSVYSEAISYSEGENLSPYFPPCINYILLKIEQGANLKHDERLFFVFFLNALKYPIDQMVNFFKILPDFDESIARYQVEFAVRKGYTPHGCAKLETLGMCQKNHKNLGDKICQEGLFSKKQDKILKLTHPLFFVSLKKSRAQWAKKHQKKP